MISPANSTFNNPNWIQDLSRDTAQKLNYMPWLKVYTWKHSNDAIHMDIKTLSIDHEQYQLV